MSNTLVFDYAVSIKEAQSASKVDYSFLSNCLVLVKGNYAVPIDSGSVALDTTTIATDAAVDTIITATAVIVPETELHVHYEWLLTGDATGGLGLVWDNETDGSVATITVLDGFDQNAGGTVTVTCSANGTELTSADLIVTRVEVQSASVTKKSKKVSRVEVQEATRNPQEELKAEDAPKLDLFTDPSDYKVVPIYDTTSFAKYTDNAEVPFFMVGGLNTVYLLIKADEVDPNDETVIDFDPTNYFTLCHSKDVDLADAKKINFTDFKGVTVYATSDLTEAEELSKTDAVFYDAGGSYAGAYEQFGYFLTQVYWRNNQYYVLDGDNPASTITTLGEADSLFEKRISFYLNGSDGPTLGFFGCGGEAITKTYLNKLIQLETQEAITSYIQVNEPNDTAVQRINIEEAAMAVIEKYEGYPYFYLDADKNNYIHILKSDDMYFVDGEAEIKIADPIWRAQIQVKEAQ